MEWKNLSDNDFYLQSKKFCKLWGKPEDTVWNYFHLWNRTFQIDYRNVRQQLKTISLENIQQSQQIEFIPYQHYLNIPPRAGYYIFLDDDDWVDPDISLNLHDKLTAFPILPHLLLWRSANIGSPTQEHVIFVWGMNGRCMTNNYAVHSDWLKPFEKIEQVIQHKDANKLFEANKATPHLDCALTVSNKSPISSVSLDRGLNGEFTQERLIWLVESYLERIRMTSDSELAYIPWAKACLEKTAQVFESVIASRR
jgi:hypothetical protein